MTTETYDPEGAAKVLEDAGWVDSDGDGVREKDGQTLTLRWLTYPSRQEQPLLAEAVQATLGRSDSTCRSIIRRITTVSARTPALGYLRQRDGDQRLPEIRSISLPITVWTAPAITTDTTTATGWRLWRRRWRRPLTQRGVRSWQWKCSR